MKIVYVYLSDSVATLRFSSGDRIARLTRDNGVTSAANIAVQPNTPVELAPGIYRVPSNTEITILRGVVSIGDPKNPPPPPPPYTAAQADIIAFAQNPAPQ